MQRDKKSVVHVAQHVAPLVLVQGLPSFFPNMYCLFDPSSTFVGRGIEQASSDEGLRYRLKRQGKNVGCVEVIVFLQ